MHKIDIQVLSIHTNFSSHSLLTMQLNWNGFLLCLHTYDDCNSLLNWCSCKKLWVWKNLWLLMSAFFHPHARAFTKFCIFLLILYELLFYWFTKLEIIIFKWYLLVTLKFKETFWYVEYFDVQLVWESLTLLVISGYILHTFL